MQKSVSNDEALRQAYAADPMQAVIDMHELAREANELEERVKELERQRDWLAQRLSNMFMNTVSAKELLKISKYATVKDAE